METVAIPGYIYKSNALLVVAQEVLIPPALCINANLVYGCTSERVESNAPLDDLLNPKIHGNR